jgi:soluble lytic murein transglycosylase
MTAWMGAWLGAWLWAVPVQAFEAPGVSRPEPPTGAELSTLLAQREEELRQLRARVEDLQALDDRRWLDEADALGVTGALARYGFTSRQQRRLAVTIVREAHTNGIDPLLVIAVIRCESSFNPYAVSGPGAMGLMQVMPATAHWLAEQRGFALGRSHNLFDTELNIELGTAYLASLIRQFGSLEHALVAYNAGPGAAKKILAKRDVRRKFIAGYPKKVVGEFKKLRARLEREMAARAASAGGNAG